jgi:CDP-glycerol glycerophosphotransferase
MWALCKKGKFPVSIVMKALKREWKYEIQRIFGGAPFDSAIQFNGYEMKSILLFSQFDCNTAIYVHNDMIQEIKTRANQRKDVLEYAYPIYDHIALVTEDLWESTSALVKSTDKFKVVHNVIDTEKIIKRGNCEIKFDKDTTKSTMDLSKLQAVLESDARVIVSVGRYSLEKAQKRMIDVFNEIWKEHKDTYFIIIGGNQRDGLYDDLCKHVKTLPCKNNVVLIFSMSNPLPLVKACDGFLLGSFYEGFGLVIVEADILGVPAVSTDITGPRLFMQKNKGVLVENSPEGVKKGFEMLIDGQVSLLTANYEEYNKQAVEEFKKII